MKAGDFSRPCSGVTTQRNTRIRSQIWEDVAPEGTSSRREQQVASPVETIRRSAPPVPNETGELDALKRFGSPLPPDNPSSGWTRALIVLSALVLLGGTCVSALLLKTYLVRDNRFRIAGSDNIEVSGINEVSRAEMLPVFGEDIGRNLFCVPIAERRRDLEKIPWIERATVMRLLPDRIRVNIVERKPVAFVRQGQQIDLIDANGVLLTMPPAMMAQHHYSFPVLTGIDPQDSPAASKTRMAVYQRLVDELDAGGQHLSEQISEIDLTDPEDARVAMAEQGGDVVAHMGEDHFLERYQRYRAHIAEWRQQYPDLATVDLRYDQQAVLQMAQASDAQPAAPDASTPADGDQAKPFASGPALDAQPAVAPAKPQNVAAVTKNRNTKTSKNSANKNASKKGNAAKYKNQHAAARHSATYISQQRKPRPAAVPGEGQ